MRRPLRAAALGAVTVAALILSPAARAETLYEAMRDAYYYNPQIEASRAALLALGENIPIAEAGRLPTLALTAQQQYTTRLTRPPTGFGRENRPLTLGLNGNLPLYDGGRAANQVSEAEANVEAAYSRLNGNEQQTLLLAAQVFYDVLRDKEIRDLTLQNLKLLKEEQEASEIRFEVGEVTLTDVAQTKSRVAAANANVVAAEGNLRASAARYRGAIGRLPTKLEPPETLPELPENLAAAEADAIANHPSIRAARSAERAALYAIRTAMSGKLPTVDLQASLQGNLSDGVIGESFFSNSRGDTRTATAGLTLSFNAPIYQGGRVDAQVRQARHTASQRRAEYHDAVRDVTENLGTSWQALISARGAIEAGIERVKAAQIAFEGVREELRVGSRATIDVLDAEAERLNARIALVRAVRDLNVAAYAVLAAIGRLDPERLGLDPVIDADTDPSVLIPENPFGYPDDATTAWRFPWRP